MENMRVHTIILASISFLNKDQNNQVFFFQRTTGRGIDEEKRGEREGGRKDKERKGGNKGQKEENKKQVFIRHLL